MVTIMVVAPGELFYDNFTRPTNTGSIFPWIQQLGTWGITNNAVGRNHSAGNYAYAYYDNNPVGPTFPCRRKFNFLRQTGGAEALADGWTRSAGAHYAAWIYPEGSSGGSANGQPYCNSIKFETWTAYTCIGSV